MTETRTYDQDYRLTGITVPAIESWSLGYNADDDITGITDALVSANNQTLGYDTLNRLNAGSDNYGSLSYLYDADGNRTTQTLNNVLTSYTYGTSNNRLTKVNATGWSYDANGNTTKDGTFTYSYDDANRMASVTKTGLTVSYLYNGLGQRVEKTVNGTSSVFIYDEAGHLLGEYTPTGTLIEEHIWLNDRPIAVITPTGTYYVHTDQLDTPRYITNSSKQLVWEWSSDPFRAIAPNQNPSGLGTFTYSLRFPGQYYDAETGHNYNYFRDYNPSIGRYLESDPVGLLGGPNTYLYVDAKPATETDSKGQYGYAKPDKTLNTVICNGEGEMIPQVVQYGDLRDECLGSCLKAHEEQHIADLKRIGTFACRGKPYGEIVKFDTLQQDYASEVNAYNTEIHCLMEKLRAMICGDKCQAMTKARIAQIQAYMQRYEQ